MQTKEKKIIKSLKRDREWKSQGQTELQGMKGRLKLARNFKWLLKINWNDSQFTLLQFSKCRKV